MRQRPPIELSYTHSNDLRCGFRFQKLVLEQAEENSFEESVKGSLLHEAAGLYGVELANQNRKTDQALFTEIMLELTKELHPSLATELMEVAGAFGSNYEQEIDIDALQFETRLGVTWPELLKCDPAEPLKKTGDRVCGTPDKVVLLDDRRTAKVQDFKFGKGRRVQYDSAGKDKQIKLYCWLVLKNNPTVERVLGELWTVQYGMNATSQVEFNSSNIDGLEQDIITDFTADFARADQLWKDYGLTEWPATGGKQCDWCKLPGCPKYKHYIEHYRRHGVEEAPPPLPI